MTFLHHYSSPLGGITLASGGEALTGLWFDGQAHYGETLSGERMERDLSVFREACLWLDLYFSGREPDFTPPLDLQGTEFRKSVWEILLTVRYGHTITYGELSCLLAEQRGLARMSPQAIGGAVSHNPVSLIIPCHRVIGAKGALTGYAGGLSRKARLLTMEQLAHSGRPLPQEMTKTPENH